MFSIKFKKFFMQHYKKLITVLTVTFLMLSLLISQALAVTYQYIMLDDYRSCVYDYYYNLYQEDNTALTQGWIIPLRDPNNNRFVATIETGSGVLDKYVHRFDLTVRFNSEFEFLAGDTVSFYFWLSSNCRLQYWDDTRGYVNCTYYLQFFRVWFADDSTFVYYPEHQYMTANQVNDLPMTIEMGTLTTAKPRIVSMQFSFNVVKGSSLGLVGIHDEPYLNIWFGNSIRTTVIRDTSQRPIYTPEDDTIIKDQQYLEDQIYNDIDDGLTGASDMWDSFGTLVSNDGRLYKGLMFVTNLLNKFLGIEIFSILGTFGLSLGIFAFLIGIVQLIKSSAERKQREQNRHNRR